LLYTKKVLSKHTDLIKTKVFLPNVYFATQSLKPGYWHDLKMETPRWFKIHVICTVIHVTCTVTLNDV